MPSWSAPRDVSLSSFINLNSVPNLSTGIILVDFTFTFSLGQSYRSIPSKPQIARGRAVVGPRVSPVKRPPKQRRDAWRQRDSCEVRSVFGEGACERQSKHYRESSNEVHSRTDFPQPRKCLCS